MFIYFPVFLFSLRHLPIWLTIFAYTTVHCIRLLFFWSKLLSPNESQTAMIIISKILLRQFDLLRVLTVFLFSFGSDIWWTVSVDSCLSFDVHSQTHTVTRLELIWFSPLILFLISRENSMRPLYCFCWNSYRGLSSQWSFHQWLKRRDLIVKSSYTYWAFVQVS